MEYEQKLGQKTTFLRDDWFEIEGIRYTHKMLCMVTESSSIQKKLRKF